MCAYLYDGRTWQAAISNQQQQTTNERNERQEAAGAVATKKDFYRVHRWMINKSAYSYQVPGNKYYQVLLY